MAKHKSIAKIFESRRLKTNDERMSVPPADSQNQLRTMKYSPNRRLEPSPILTCRSRPNSDLISVRDKS